jgi:putative oxidoreductase
MAWPSVLDNRIPFMKTAALAAVGRLLIAALFLTSGLGKLAAPAMTIGYIASVALPFPTLGYAVAVTIEVGGSLFLLAGFQTRTVAIVMTVFTLITAVGFHSDFSDQNQMIHFLKNVALAGGLLQVVAFGPGLFSLDARRSARLSIATPRA